MLDLFEARELTEDELREVTGGTANEHAHPQCGGGHGHGGGYGYGGGNSYYDEEIHGIIYIN
jgi:bacteriocin-like protein